MNELVKMLFTVAARPHVEACDNGRFMSPDQSNIPEINRVLDLIRKSPGSTWTIETLANEVSMSRTALSVKFRDAVGDTLFSYLTRFRIDYAKLLLSSNMPTKQICKVVGYGSEAAFVRAFGRINGVTPKEFRKSAASRSSIVNSNRLGMTGGGEMVSTGEFVARRADDNLKIQTLYCMIAGQELIGLFPNYMDAIKASKALVGMKGGVVIRPIVDVNLSLSHWKGHPLVGGKGA